LKFSAVTAGLFLSALPVLPGRAAELVPAPADAGAWAARDLASLQVKARGIAQRTKTAFKSSDLYGYRYLWVGPDPADEKIADWKIANLQVNLLSRHAARTKLYVVPESNWCLLRLNLEDYGIDPAMWDRMGIQDPIFFFTAEEKVVKYETVMEEYETRKKGKIKIVKRAKRVPRNTSRRIQTVYPPPKMFTVIGRQREDPNWYVLCQTTTHSAAPIVSLQWFFYATATAENRDEDHPGYYQFLGVKTQRDFERLVGYHHDWRQGFTELLAVVKNSGVARQPRQVRRDRGGYWRTFDNTLAVDRFSRVKGQDIFEPRNPLRNPDNRTFRFDATESFGRLPNDGPAMGLWNEDGQLQQFAPGFVGHNSKTRSNNGRILVPVSCLHCHADYALQNLQDFFRTTTLGRKKINDLVTLTPDRHKARLFADQYTRPLDVYLASDRRWYQIFFWELTEWNGARVAEVYSYSWHQWTERPVSLLRASRELGVTVEVFKSRLEAYVRALGGVDPPLAAFLSPDVSEANLPRDQWNEVYPLARFVVLGEVPLDFAFPKGYARGTFLRTMPKKRVNHEDSNAARPADVSPDPRGQRKRRVRFRTLLLLPLSL
jgi:hypothetical protein